MTTKLTLLCTGSPAPLAHRGGSGYLVRTDTDTILIDCGPACVRRLLEAGVELTSIDHLLFTHLHYDHCVDYAYLVLTRWDQGVGQIPEISVIGPKPTAHMTNQLFSAEGVFGPDLKARTQHPGSHFIYEARGGSLPRHPPNPNVHEVGDGEVLSIGNCQLEVSEVLHVQPQLTCLAYRLTTPEATIVFGGDTAPVPALNNLARDADVLLHMCHFINGVVTDQRATTCMSGHIDAARTAQDSGVQTLVLVHLTEQLESPGVRERILAEVAEVYDGQVILGHDLLEVPIGKIDPAAIR